MISAAVFRGHLLDGAVASEQVDAIRRDLEEVARARKEEHEAELSARKELDSVLAAKNGLEASLLKEQEECRDLRGQLQGSKEQQGALGNELESLKKELTRHTSLAEEHEGRSA